MKHRLSPALALGAATLFALSCSKSEPAGPAPVVALAPVPAPAGLLADVFVAHPGTTWAAIRGGIGGPLALLPESAATLEATMLGLPPIAIEQMDPGVPALGALVDDGTHLATVLAIHVKDGPRLAELLSTGDTARFTKKPDAESGVTLLDPRGGTTTLAASLAVSGNYLAIAARPDDLVRFAPYVTRTLPTKPAPAEDIVAIAPRSALAGPLSKKLRGLWDDWKKEREADDAAMRQKHGGSAPDFGDPTEALAHLDSRTIGRLMSLLGDLDEARLVVTADPSALHARVAMKPSAGAGAAGQEFSAMAIGDGKPLLDLPSACPIALLTRDTAETRAASASDESEALGKIFGGRLAASDKTRVDGVLQAWAKGRGDWLTVGGVWTPTTHAALVRGSVSDPGVLGKAVVDFLKLTDVPAIAEPLRNFIGEVKVSAPSAGAGGTQTVRLVRKAPKLVVDKGKDPKQAPDDLDVIWSVDKDALALAVGRDAKSAYGTLTGAPAGPSLGQVPEVATAVGALGKDIAFALVLQPMQLVAGAVGKDAGKQPSAPVLFAYGRTGTDGWFRLDVADVVVREWVKMRGL